MKIEVIFMMLYGSLKYNIPIIETPIMPSPDQIANAKLKSNFFNANRKIVNPIAQKTNVKIEEYNFVNPSDIFMLVVPSNSTIIPINNNIHIILAPLVFLVISNSFL